LFIGEVGRPLIDFSLITIAVALLSCDDFIVSQNGKDCGVATPTPLPLKILVFMRLEGICAQVLLLEDFGDKILRNMELGGAFRR
jgi:hypothetical protein